MRVAFLTHEPFHPPSGGGSAEAPYLVKEFVRRGHEVHVFAPQDQEPEQVERRFGVRLHRFTRWRMGRYARWRNFKYLLYPWALARQVIATGSKATFDVVLGQHTISCVAAGQVKHHLGVVAVMNFLDYLTGFMETWPRWKMPPPALAFLKRFELTLPGRFAADAVLTVSDALADRLAARGFPRERLHPIYYGYDAACFRYNPEAVMARNDAPPTVVMHGSFDQHHLQRIAVEAVARVRAERPDARFEFLGPETGAWRGFRQAASALGLGEALHHAGFVPYAEVASRLARASVGIVPYEASAGTHCAFVAKVVEYLALGLPVACTPLEGVQRYFGNEPLVRFSRFDGSSLGQVVLQWLREPLAARAASAEPAARKVRDRLDWSVICAHAVDVVESTVGNARRRGR